jgi:hypothetical protein
MSRKARGKRVREKVKRKPRWNALRKQGLFFPTEEDRLSREERLRRIKRIVDNEGFVTEKRLDEAIERLINFVIFH